MALSNTTMNSSQVSYILPTFRVVDYLVFVAFLSISGFVGIFFSLRGQKTTGEYFFGGRKMRPIPVGISTGVSFLSAAAFVGLPAEMFVNGYSYIFGVFCGAVGYFIGCITVVHILHPLQMTSLNEYVAKRFNSKVLTTLGHTIVLACIFHYMGGCMYGSVVAFNSMTGGQVSVIAALAIGGIVGIFYTSIGGLKAVVWTDVIQSGIMIVGILTVIIQSIVDTPGGMANIFKINVKYERIHALDWSVDPRIRHSGWGMTIGRFIGWGIWCVQPACVQRLCSTSSRKDSFIVSAIAASLFFVFASLPAWAGINIFGYYISKGCDVYAAGWIERNEIILYYVRDRLSHPGFQGLFLAALYAGSLSSLSSGLNTASAILWQDIAKPLISVEVSDFKATLISKVIVVIFGLGGMIWCYTLYSFGGMILQAINSIEASMFGAYFALFFLAIFFRYANSKGAIAGLLVSFSITLWLGLSSLIKGAANLKQLPTTTENCAINATLNYNSSISITEPLELDKEQSLMQSLYSISYVWLSTLCLVISILVALMVTACTQPVPVGKVHPSFLFPLCRPKLKTKGRIMSGDDVEACEETEKLSADDDSETCDGQVML